MYSVSRYNTLGIEMSFSFPGLLEHSKDERTSKNNTWAGLMIIIAIIERVKQLKYYILGHWAVVLDIPLLFEGPLHLYCGTTLVVAVSDPAVQMARLRARDPHLSPEDAENRVRSQGDVRDKAARALGRGEGRGVVVWNDGEIEQLRTEVSRVVNAVRQRSPAWWTWLCLLCPVVGVGSAVTGYLVNRTRDGAWLRERDQERAKL